MDRTNDLPAAELETMSEGPIRSHLAHYLNDHGWDEYAAFVAALLALKVDVEEPDIMASVEADWRFVERVTATIAAGSPNVPAFVDPPWVTDLIRPANPRLHDLDDPARDMALGELHDLAR